MIIAINTVTLYVNMPRDFRDAKVGFKREASSLPNMKRKLLHKHLQYAISLLNWLRVWLVAGSDSMFVLQEETHEEIK